MKNVSMLIGVLKAIYGANLVVMMIDEEDGNVLVDITYYVEDEDEAQSLDFEEDGIVVAWF